jgi:hypothetical protein
MGRRNLLNCEEMRKKPLQAIVKTGTNKPPPLDGRRKVIGYLRAIDSSLGAHRKYTTKIQHIADTLVAAGYTSLNKQAQALGIHRSTAWTIIKKKHKLGRLNTNTTNRMLANPELPPPGRAVIQQYLAERFDASPKSLTDD